MSATRRKLTPPGAASASPARLGSATNMNISATATMGTSAMSWKATGQNFSIPMLVSTKDATASPTAPKPPKPIHQPEVAIADPAPTLAASSRPISSIRIASIATSMVALLSAIRNAHSEIA